MTATTNRYGLGWRPQAPDFRDYPYVPSAIPPHGVASLREHMPAPVLDQGALGSCVSNATARCILYDRARQGETATLPSRLFIYYEGRKIEGTTRQDSGLNIRDGIKVIATQGAPPEALWPYDIAKFKRKPPVSAYKAAASGEALAYYSLDAGATPRLDAIRASIAEGYPVVFGFTVYSSFQSSPADKTGLIPMPTKRDRIEGGHCVAAIGYDDARQLIECANSWSDAWGDGGYFWLPYAYIAHPRLASDFWTVRKVGQG